MLSSLESSFLNFICLLGVLFIYLFLFYFIFGHRVSLTALAVLELTM